MARAGSPVFLQSKEIIGDDEQYAATMALLANAVGVPARVSLDGTVEANGSVYGRDVRADVELDLVPYGWVTLPASQFTGTKQPTLRAGDRPAAASAGQGRAAAEERAPRRSPSATQSNAVSRGSQRPAGQGFAHPRRSCSCCSVTPGCRCWSWPSRSPRWSARKTLRRRRRRGAGPPAARVAGAWRELLDLGRDLGMTRGRARRHAGNRPPRPSETASRRLRRSRWRLTPRCSARRTRMTRPRSGSGSSWTQARRDATANFARWRRAWVAVNPASLWAWLASSGRPGDALRAVGSAVGNAAPRTAPHGARAHRALAGGRHR